MIRFIHTADVHFGMENYGRVDSKTGIHSRLLDFEKALNFCIDFAIEKKVDFFLFAGDAYKTANPTPTHQRLLAKCLLKLYQAKIPIIMIVGNHDNSLSFGKAHALEIFGQIPLDGFHVIAKPTTIVLQTKSGPIQIVGIPWPTKNSISINDNFLGLNPMQLVDYISKSVTTIIQDLASKLDPSLPAVLTGHLTVSSGIFSGSEKRAVYGTDPIFLPSQLGIKPFDYVALGHLHRFQNLNPNNTPPIVYSGSIERVDFGERKEDKGFCYVTIENKNKTHFQFIKTPIRPFIQVEVKLIDLESQTDQIIKEIAKYDINGAILKIIYYLPPEKRDRIDIAAIQQACSAAWYIVGIIPIRSHAIKEGRLSLKVDMDLEKLLDCYFSTKAEYRNDKERLIKKALMLEHDSHDFDNDNC